MSFANPISRLLEDLIDVMRKGAAGACHSLAETSIRSRQIALAHSRGSALLINHFRADGKNSIVQKDS